MTRESYLKEVTLGTPERGEIQLSPYNKDWPRQYEAEAEKIRRALGTRIRGLEHVGSTSVPGLMAKPILDILLLVEDSGPGLPPELMEHLFEPFLADSAQDGARHGVGLGLYLAREYSLAMGWGFSLESGPAGTSVRLDIPADPLPSTGHASLRSASRSLAVRSRQADRLRTAQSCLAL